MRVYVANVVDVDGVPGVLNAIDAVAVQTKPMHPQCRSCHRKSYVIARQPPLGGDADPEVQENSFVDK